MPRMTIPEFRSWSDPLPDGCRPWTGKTVIGHEGKTWTPRQWAWVHLGGEEKPPLGQVVKARCGTDGCVEVAHLFLRPRAPEKPRKRCARCAGYRAEITRLARLLDAR